MKKTCYIPLILAALCLALAPLAFVGCGTTGSVSTSYDESGQVGGNLALDVSTNATVVASGGYNVSTGQWTVAVGLTFREAPPVDVVTALEAAGAQPGKAGGTWIFPAGMKPADVKVQRALTAAASAPGGYLLTPLK